MRSNPVSGSRLRAAVRLLALGLSLSWQTLPAYVASELHDLMGVGINYGNHFDKDRTNANTAVIPKAKFDTIKAAGFGHVRLPVCWGYRINAWPASAGTPVTIRQTFLNNVKASVDNALAAGLVVVINTHHEDWFQTYWSEQNNASIKFNNTTFAYATATAANGGRPALDVYKDIYRQILATLDGDAKYDKVIFEGLNEPRIEAGSGAFTSAKVNTLNNTTFNLVQDDLNGTTRRTYLMTVNDANNSKSFKNLTLPSRGGWTDADVRERLMITLHYYYNLNWTHWDTPAQTTWGSAADYDALLERFNEIMPVASNFTQANSPLAGVKVNIGEFGIAHDKSDRPDQNDDDVLEWYRAVSAAAQKRGFSATVWDDNGWFKVFNRADGAGGSFDWSNACASEIWKQVTLFKNEWTLTSGAGPTLNLAASGTGDWSAWELAGENPADAKQRFTVSIDPGAVLGERDEIKYVAMKNVGGARYLDIENDTTVTNGSLARSRGGALDTNRDHYVSFAYTGGGACALILPIPAGQYPQNAVTGAGLHVLDIPDPFAVGTDAVLWDFETTNANSQRWFLEKTP